LAHVCDFKFLFNFDILSSLGLINPVDALQKADTEMKMLEKQLQRTKSLIQIYNNGIEHVFSHLKLKKPLFIYDESRIITFNHNEAGVSLNVL